MVDYGLVGLGILVLILVLFLFFCKIWQHLTKTSQTDNRVDDVVTESLIPEDLSVGQNIRCPLLAREHADRDTGVLREDHLDSSIICSTLILEVISGPSSGIRVSQQSTNVSGLSLRIGRVPENDLAVNDPEVSGKHALVNWNSKNSKWELVDMGSLNGTRLNSQPVSASDSSLRCRSSPVQLANGDVITLGSTSKVFETKYGMQTIEEILREFVKHGFERMCIVYEKLGAQMEDEGVEHKNKSIKKR